MHAFLIDPEAQTIEAIELGSRDELPSLIGYPTIESDSIGDSDLLFFDEECFIRGLKGRFQIDKLIPVAGKGVVVGADGDELRDVAVDLEALRARTKFQ